jgi:hypothetical protein
VAPHRERTYSKERIVAYNALPGAGLSTQLSKQLIYMADQYFTSISVTGFTHSRIQENNKRRKMSKTDIGKQVKNIVLKLKNKKYQQLAADNYLKRGQLKK